MGDRRMEFGMFHQFPAIPGRTQKAAFAEAFEQIDAAERWGLDTMWLAELHFDPQRSVLSAPLSIAAAGGARTERGRSALPSRSCRCAPRCASPRRPRRSITSAAAG